MNSPYLIVGVLWQKPISGPHNYNSTVKRWRWLSTFHCGRRFIVKSCITLACKGNQLTEGKATAAPVKKKKNYRPSEQTVLSVPSAWQVADSQFPQWNSWSRCDSACRGRWRVVRSAGPAVETGRRVEPGHRAPHSATASCRGDGANAPADRWPAVPQHTLGLCFQALASCDEASQCDLTRSHDLDIRHPPNLTKKKRIY